MLASWVSLGEAGAQPRGSRCMYLILREARAVGARGRCLARGAAPPLAVQNRAPPAAKKCAPTWGASPARSRLPQLPSNPGGTVPFPSPSGPLPVVFNE